MGGRGASSGLRPRQGRYVSKSLSGTSTNFGRRAVEKASLKYDAAQKLEKPLTSDEIIAKISGEDKNYGACSSLALVYIGNENGYDVKDFKSKESCDYFADVNNLLAFTYLKDVESYTELSSNDFETVNKLKKKIQAGKTYFLKAGEHAAIVRKAARGYEYLELQPSTLNPSGWKALTSSELKKRFDCAKKHTMYGVERKVYSILIEGSSLAKTDEFVEALGYVNNVSNG